MKKIAHRHHNELVFVTVCEAWKDVRVGGGSRGSLSLIKPSLELGAQA